MKENKIDCKTKLSNDHSFMVNLYFLPWHILRLLIHQKNHFSTKFDDLKTFLFILQLTFLW